MIQIDWASAITPPAETRNKFKEVAAGPPILPSRADREPEEASAGSSNPPPQSEEITAGPWTISRGPARSPGKIGAEVRRRREVLWQLVEAAAGLPVSRPPVQSRPEQIAMESPISPLPKQFQQDEIAAELPIPLLTDRQLEEVTAGPSISPSPIRLPPVQMAAESPSSPPPTQRQLNEIKAGPPIALSPEAQPEEAAARPPISPSPTQFQPQVIAAEPPIAPHTAQRRLDQEEIAILLKRGKDLIANGDLAAARVVLQRAADANDAEAALALGATYDPYVLRALKVYGFKADPVMARVWYEKARELGSAAAPRRLEMLTNGMR